MDATQRIKAALNIADIAVRYACKIESSSANGDALLLDCVGGKLEKQASLSVFQGGKAFKLHNTDDVKGDVFNFIQYKENCDFRKALEIAADYAGITLEPVRADPRVCPGKKQDKALHEHIASKCLAEATDARLVEYLTGRGISKAAIERAITCKTLGMNTYKSATKQPGEKFYGGEAAAFIVRSRNPGHIQAVDMRYFDPALNGGLKTQCQGNKDGHFWCADYNALKHAAHVVIVESSINALSIDSAELKNTAAIAVLGTGNIANMDWVFLRGKTVTIAFDKDQPKKKNGKWQAPGQQAAWKLYDMLSDLGISAFLVNHDSWTHGYKITDEHINHYLADNPEEQERLNKIDPAVLEHARNKIANTIRTTGIDVNDLLKEKGPEEIRRMLKDTEQWLIPGVGGKQDKDTKINRVFLPEVDRADYWRFRTSPEHTWYMKTMMVTEKDETGETVKNIDGKPEKEEKEVPQDVCGFRIANLRRVEVSDYVAATSGTEDHSPETFYVAHVQTRLEKARLKKKVFKEELYNIKKWESHFGAVYNQNIFKRALTTLENTAGLNVIKTTNIVGLSWMDGKLIATEGPDCFFAEPDKQCASYHHMTFHSGTKEDAIASINQWRNAYKGNQGLIMLDWALNTHMKMFTNAYPHMLLGGPKGTAKSYLAEMLGVAVPMHKYSLPEMNDYRLRIATAGTSFPIMIDELTNAKVDKRLLLSNQLQNLYTKEPMNAGSPPLLYLKMAPVMVGGEDLGDMDNVLSKTVRTMFKLEDRGDFIHPSDVVKFPVKQWLEFYCGIDRKQGEALYAQALTDCQKKATGTDATSERMIRNYANLLLGWRLLCEFTGLPVSTFGMEHSIYTEMNMHIGTTEADREPWVKIIDKITLEMSREAYPYPWGIETITSGFKGKTGDGIPASCLLIKPSEIMDYINSDRDMREFRDRTPISGKAELLRQLESKGMVWKKPVHPRIGPKDASGNPSRLTNYIAIPLFKLLQYGITVPGGDYDSDELRDLIEGMED